MGLAATSRQGQQELTEEGKGRPNSKKTARPSRAAPKPSTTGAVRLSAPRSLVEMTEIDGTLHCRVYRAGGLVGLFAMPVTSDARPILEQLARALKAPNPTC